MTFSLLFLLNFQAKAYTVSTNTTWSSSYPTFSDITVENGATFMKDMYVVIDTLVHNGHNWDTLPNTVKQNVTNVANGNGAYGTPVARYLLARYEGIYYYPNDSLLSKTVHFADNKPNPGALFQAQQRSEKNKIYPNPATNQLMVNWSSQGKSTLKLFDVFGKQVFKAAIHQGETTLNIGQLASGIYTATISQKGHSVYQQKIIKK